jgi:uncharacterized membrane protein
MSPPVVVPRLFPLFRLVFGLAAACFVGALVTDIVYSQVPDMQWSNFSMWLITAGLVIALAAAIVGLVELAVGRPQRWFRTGWALPVGAAVASIVAVFNAFVHSRDAWESVVPTGLTLSVVTVLILLLIPVFERSPRAAERFA